MFKTIEKTLSANTNILQLTDSVIDNDSIIEVYGDDEEVIAVGVDVSGHTLTVTFDSKLPDAHDVKIFVNNLDGEFSPTTGSVTDAQVSITSTGITETTQKAINEKVYDTVRPNNLTVGGVLYHGTTGNEWKVLNGNNINYDSSYSVNAKIDQCFQYVSNGKELIADAITDKGIETSASDTFQTMADNIALIETGGDLSSLHLLGSVTSPFNNTANNYIFSTSVIGDNNTVLLLGYVQGGNGRMHYGAFHVNSVTNGTYISLLDSPLTWSGRAVALGVITNITGQLTINANHNLAESYTSGVISLFAL